MIGDFKIIRTRSGIPLLARLVKPGEMYGTRHSRIHAGPDLLIEVYDTRHDHTDLGRVVARYLAYEVMHKDSLVCMSITGLEYDVIDASAHIDIRSWLRRK